MNYLDLWIFPGFRGSFDDAENAVAGMARREGISYGDAIRVLWPHLRHTSHMNTLAHMAYGNGYAEFIDRNPLIIKAVPAEAAA